MNIKNRVWYIILIGCFGGGSYLFLNHFFVSDIPLGYDPGLYKSMFEAYSQLQYRDFSQLPAWIQRMYPPFLGMERSVFSLMTGLNADRGVRRGAGWLALLVCFMIGAFTRSLGGKKAGIIALCFAITSFTIYNLFWRNYLKQMMAIILLLSILILRYRKNFWISVPIISSLIITHRPGLALLGLIGIIIMIGYGVKRDRKSLQGLVYAAGFSGMIVLPIYRLLVKIQIYPLIEPFFSSINSSIVHDTYQAGGTFLTTGDFGKTQWIIFIIGAIGLLWGSLKDRSLRCVYSIPTVVLLAWVGFQRFFFQRMIGYLAVFLIVGVGVFGGLLLKRRNKLGLLFLIITFLGQSIISVVRIEKIKTPIIEKDEFAFITNFDTLIAEEEAIIIVPGARYSPRVEGRTRFGVIAPGLFDLNKRGTLEQDWQKRWILASGDEKCESIDNDYRKLHKKLYVRIGSKQPFTDMAGECFQLIKAQKEPFAALYRVDRE